MSKVLSPNLRLARSCVERSRLAYQVATVESPLAHVLVEREVQSSEFNVQSAAILAFRGSAAIEDWLTDARIAWADTGLGWVHRGFWASTNSVIDLVRRLDQRESPAPVVVTGHSKGAAEALICAWLLARAGRTVASVVTFGGPRVGDAHWRSSYNSQVCGPAVNGIAPTLGSRTFRWVHEEDLVTRLPVWVTGYRHVGQECFLSSLGGCDLNPPLWRKGLSDLWGTVIGYRRGRIEQLADHPVGQYQEDLGKL